jgi:hypothetical protein
MSDDLDLMPETAHFRAFCETGPCEWSSPSEDTYNNADDRGSDHLALMHPGDKQATCTIDEIWT